MSETVTAPDDLPVAVTMGEPSGIGTEITLKAYLHLRELAPGGVIPFLLIDDPARVSAVRRMLGMDVPVVTISGPAEAKNAFASGLPVLPLPAAINDTLQISHGKPSVEHANVVIASIDKSVKLALAGEVSGIVTNPIQKEVLTSSGFKFPGHTEYLGHLTKNAEMPSSLARGPVMMLAGKSLKVTPVTVHIPLEDVAPALSVDRIVSVCRVVAESLLRDFAVQNPVLAVAGLNPHAGEAGTIGLQEQKIIGPALEVLKRAGVNVMGPLPADTMFHEQARAQYHAAITMYHDQGLIPIKTIDFFGAVNITLGLPIVRTSPDHGTGLNIAGKGIANPQSLVEAIKMAHLTHLNRKRFDTLTGQA
ncbi:MAG: 4-hydroxythreonine-4-phosphate dehydrogenase PdxA [Aquisalinus sp.]|nr:4-hydroxythreonine-4-phosphate dehydrogenase PdxA [Aquisalinus sp.]